MSKHSIWKTDLARLMVSVLALAGIFVAGVAWYTQWSPQHLPAMADGLGEVWMARAARSEAAGALEEARASYERALAGHFHGDQNRVHCEKRIGVVLFKLGRYEEALSHLQKAQESPLRSFNGYAPLFDTLVALDRWEEAKTVAHSWFDAAEAAAAHGEDPPYPALARLALHDGDPVGARDWLQHAAAWRPDHPIQPQVARLYAELNDLPKARATLEAYLETARPSDDTAQDWALLEGWSQSASAAPPIQIPRP